MNRGIISLAAGPCLACLLFAASGCKDEAPPKTVALRYAYVEKDPGEVCGQIKVVEGIREVGEVDADTDADEVTKFDAADEQCQTRPQYGPSGELSWLTFDADEGQFGEWLLQIQRADNSQRTLRRYGVADIGRVAWSPDAKHLGFYYQIPGEAMKLAYYDTVSGTLGEEIELNAVAIAADTIYPDLGRAMRHVSWPDNSKRLFFPTYEAMDPSLPRFNMDVHFVAPHEDTDGFEEGHLSFDGILDYDRIRQAVWTSRGDRLYVHGQLADGSSHVLRIDIGATRVPTLLYTGGDIDNWFGPLQVSPDGSAVAFSDQGKLILATDSAPARELLSFPGEPLSWLNRKLQWIGNERIAYTVDAQPMQIEVYDLRNDEASVLVARPGKDVYELSWDPNALGREENGLPASGGDEETGTETGTGQ